jgi:DNA-binding transcriptional LysR family regulator
MSFDERVLNGMGVLVRIVESGNFAAAAEVLNMTPSGVSRSIARLECRLGIRLFDRTTRSVKLTDEGRRVYDQVVPLLDSLEEVASSAAQDASVVRGRLRVNIDPLFSRMAFGQRLGSFVERHPELQVDLITRDQLGDVMADGFDVAIRLGEPRVSTLIARKLLDTRIVTVASPIYIKKHGRPRVPGDLESEPHVCIKYRDPETGRSFPWEFDNEGKRVVISARGNLTADNVEIMHGVCLAGHGVAQIFELGAEKLLASGRLVDLFPDWPGETLPLYAMYVSRRRQPAKVRAFFEFIASTCGLPLQDLAPC